MQMEVRSKGFSTTAAIRAHVEKRLGFALDRFGSHIRSVAVWLGDMNGPKGGVDKCCRIAVDLGGNHVALEESAADLYHAVDHAAHRLRTKIVRELEREHALAVRRTLAGEQVMSAHA